MAFKNKNKKDVEVSVDEAPEIVDVTVVETTEDIEIESIKEDVEVFVDEVPEIVDATVDETPAKVQKEDTKQQKTLRIHPLKYVEEAMSARSWNVGNVVSIIQDFSTDAERETILNLNYENCKITLKMAMLFEYVFGISHLTWLKYQSDYETI